MLTFEKYRLLNVLNKDIKKGLNMKLQTVLTINDLTWAAHMKTHMGHLGIDGVSKMEILTKFYIHTNI